MFNIFHKSKIATKLLNNNFSQKITQIFTHRKLDTNSAEELEELLITSDIGHDLTSQIINKLMQQKFAKSDLNKDSSISFSNVASNVASNVVIDFLKQEILSILKPCEETLKFNFNIKPLVMVFNGVNGAGKTTTIAKIAKNLKDNNKRVLIAACDTFRAAAASQLKSWADKIAVDIILPIKENEDPAAVAFRSLDFAVKNNFDVLLIDTAGRLHNKQNLMDELKKINKVLKKIDETTPHHNFLIIDATTGRNSHNQLAIFDKEVNIDGLIITKLDGSAKGGSLISLAHNFKKPIYAIGIGEKDSDLQEFNAESFVANILNL